MNKMFFAVAALAVSVGFASAQGPAPLPMPAGPSPAGYPVAGPGYGGPAYGGPADGGYYGGPGYGYGGHGFLKHTGFLSGLFCNHGGARGGDPRNVNTLPVASGGTLVYPQNPFVRSPRDYFMWDER